ncbi:MAG: type II toxin-antitoxin system RelE/ParE family toxin [Thermodesulfobacteriota bacterium]
MKVRWTDRARRDLLDIGEYIARDNRAAARSWVERLRARARKAAETPLAGRVVPELGRDDVREVFVRTCRIVYEVREDAIHVLAVFEGHRLLQRSSEP